MGRVAHGAVLAHPDPVAEARTANREALGGVRRSGAREGDQYSQRECPESSGQELP
jgi:hypothetical protein